MRFDMRGRALDIDSRPGIMGILNITPDSFYDGGRYLNVDEAFARARAMARDGADIIDIGGESTRPGSSGVAAREEIERLAPVVERICGEIDVAVSIDTRKAEVARAMLELGAHMINDVSGFGHDENMAGVVVEFGVPVVLMHMRATPGDMQEHTDYVDVVSDVRRELMERVAAAEAGGVARGNILIDPGIGFSKTAEQSAEIIARLDEFVETGYPVVLGPSRKSFMGELLGLRTDERLEATIATCIWAVLKGVMVVRVHDVGPVVRAVKMLRAVAAMSKSEDIKVPE
jgi:dihydropteroate synthase